MALLRHPLLGDCALAQCPSGNHIRLDGSWLECCSISIGLSSLALNIDAVAASRDKRGGGYFWYNPYIIRILGLLKKYRNLYFNLRNVDFDYAS